MNSSRDVPATELRSRLAAFLDEARAGGTVVVTRSGRPAARLVPPDLDQENHLDAD
jgi:prevent-host-death family protein